MSSSVSKTVLKPANNSLLAAQVEQVSRRASGENMVRMLIDENYTRAKALSRLFQEKKKLDEKIFVKNIKKAKDVDSEKDFDLAQKEIQTVPELVIFSAMPVSDEVFSDLGRKARKLFGKNLFIDLKVDPALLGGAALAWKGQYKDYSLKAKFEEQKEVLKGVYEQFTQDRRGRICPQR